MTHKTRLAGSSVTSAALLLLIAGSAIGQGEQGSATAGKEGHTVDSKGAHPRDSGGIQVGGAVPRISAESLYRGWRARQLLGRKAAAAEDHRPIGKVRELVVNVDGQITAVLIESGDDLESSDSLLRVPWDGVERNTGQDGLSVRLKDRAGNDTSLFMGEKALPASVREFRLSELLGDYVRLETGLGYGAITDVVFSPADRIHAVLVTRDVFGGRGIYAYPIGKLDTKWEPGLSYFGLPYIVPAQANAAGLKIDPTKFQDSN